MKKRLIKKLISKHLNPLIKGMEKANSYSYISIEDIGNGMYQQRAFDNNHSLWDGYKAGEGRKLHPRVGIKNGILRTAKAINEIKNTYEVVILRIMPELSNGRIYCRLITERVAK